MLTPGSTMGGRYRLEERIATGGMGDVWRAEDTVLGRTIAIKVLHPAMLEEPGFAERFRAEARIMATLNHPGVVRVYDYGESTLDGGGHAAFLVMEHVECEPLSRVLAKHGRLAAKRTMDLVAQAADALHAAHQRGIIHRDVKPGNLLVKADGTLVLTDFGIARSALSSQLTQVGSVLGTAAYVSPEQASGTRVTPASDVYSLGVVAYQCLAGRRPFDGDNALEVAMRHVRDQVPPLPPDVPAGARQLVERALVKDPGGRWPTAAAMAAAARQVASGGSAAPTSPAAGATAVLPPVAPTSGGGYRQGSASVPTMRPASAVDYHTPTPTPQPQSPKRSSGLLIVLIAGILAALVGLGVAGYMVLRDDNQPGTTPTQTNTRPQSAVIAENELIGKRYDVARQLLIDKGFTKIKRAEKAFRNAREGTVTDVSPTGEVSTDREVTLFVQPRGGGGPTLPPLGTPTRSATPSKSPGESDSPSPAASESTSPGGGP